jgi:hypothetical protein
LLKKTVADFIQFPRDLWFSLRKAAERQDFKALG